MEEKQSEKSFLSFLRKENTEGVLNIIKIVFSIALIGGIIWSVGYYMSIRNFPDLDFPNLIAYLIAVFVIGLFVVTVFFILFILPGLILFFMIKENKEETKYELKKLLDEKILRLKIVYLLYIIPSILTIALGLVRYYILPSLRDFQMILILIALIVIVMACIVCFKNKSLCCNVKVISIVSFSSIIFILLPLTIAIYFTSHVEMNEGFWVGIFTFCLMLLIASILMLSLPLVEVGRTLIA